MPESKSSYTKQHSLSLKGFIPILSGLCQNIQNVYLLLQEGTKIKSYAH